MTLASLLLTLVALLVPPASAEDPPANPTSGGVLLPEQAAYDVRSYDLRLTVKPSEKTIEGTLIMRADVKEEPPVAVQADA